MRCLKATTGAVLRLDDVRRELHSATVLVSGKDRPDCNVSEDVVRKSRLSYINRTLSWDAELESIVASVN